MGQDLDPGRGWEYRPLCSVTPLSLGDMEPDLSDAESTIAGDTKVKDIGSRHESEEEELSDSESREGTTSPPPRPAPKRAGIVREAEGIGQIVFRTLTLAISILCRDRREGELRMK